MKYVYKCTTCSTEREVEHSVAECDTHVENCNDYKLDEDNPNFSPVCSGTMHRVMQPSIVIWPGGSPSGRGQ